MSFVCEVNWLDPEPDEAEYLDEYLGFQLDVIEKLYGFHQPPTQEEYNGLYEDEDISISESDDDESSDDDETDDN